jgi:hypothetical protein
MAEAFWLLSMPPRNQKVPCEFSRIKDKSRCVMQLCRGWRHEGLGGESEIRSSCTCCDGWMLKSIGSGRCSSKWTTLDVNFFHVNIYVQAGWICVLLHFSY